MAEFPPIRLHRVGEFDGAIQSGSSAHVTHVLSTRRERKLSVTATKPASAI